MKIVSTPNAPQAIGPYSQAIILGDIIYTSGQIALRPDGSFLDGDIISQTRQVLENLKHVLESQNSSLSKVIKTTVFLSDMNNFNQLNEVYAQYFENHKPARTTVAVKTLPRNALVEIECIAQK
ncbi:RidA family protein [Helicobacter cappadocius]|uniref:RidA family protein n=1 Tax=Helicobacter cappadocius TaxID=3063998 RepID=A0AA90PIT3_9HELI|nr:MULTISPECIES: RidA family protein [unclassified Helicobacter]MDO7252738.1 RidA family protein [Helicobacter sp. faydin-H75]MDP2538606.1 RidA family protein [Helicobacter sp. faydin-H76]